MELIQVQNPVRVAIVERQELMGQPSLLNKVIEAVKYAASFVFKTALHLGLFFTSTAMYSIGFVAGVIEKERITQMHRNIEAFWARQNARTIAMIAIGATSALPVTIVLGAFFTASHYSCQL